MQPCWKKYTNRGWLWNLRCLVFFPLYCLCFGLFIQDLSSQFPSPVTMPCDYAWPHALPPAFMLSQLLLTLTLWNHIPNTLFILYIIVLMVFYHSNRKTTTASGLWHKTGHIISIVCSCFVFTMRYKRILVLLNKSPEHIHLMLQPTELSPNSVVFFF